MERSLSLAGSTINARYRVKAVSGVTPDVVIYAAEELRFGRPLFLKVLRDDVARDAEFATAVREQASALALSAHADRGVPRVYECGATNTGELYIALERTEGTTLRAVLAEGALRPTTALRIASKIGEALETLHHNGIVHGELGPETVLLVKEDAGDERIALIDVELTAAHRTPIGRRRRSSPPPYLVPEEMEKGQITQASDQYALGMLLRELLTAGRDTVARQLPRQIESILQTALDPQPERRFPDISVMVNEMWAAQTALAEAGPRRRTDGVHLRRRQRPRAPEVPVSVATVAAAGIVVLLGWAAFSLPSVLLAVTSVPVRAITTVPTPALTVPTPALVQEAIPHVASPKAPRVEDVSTPEPPAQPVTPPVAVAPVPAAPAPVAPAPVVAPPQRSAAPAAPRRVESLTRAQPPAKVEPPVRIEPIVKPEPPVKAEPPVKTTPTVKLEPTGKAEPAPVKIAPTVKAEPPVKIAPTVKADPPVKSAPPVKLEPPLIKVEPPAKPAPTVKAEAPARVERPAKAEPPAQPPAKAPAKATPPAPKEEAAADRKDGTEIIDWLLKPRR